MDSYSLPLLEDRHSLRRAGLFAVPAKAQLAPEGLAPWRRVERCRRVSETVGESLLTGPLREGWCGRPACHRRRVERRPHVFGKILRIPLDGITQMTPRSPARFIFVLACLFWNALAAELPAGTPIEIRLTPKFSTTPSTPN